MSELAASFGATNLRGAFSSLSPPSKASTKKSKSAKKDVKPFRFFDLPRELRDRIYRMALVTGIIDVDLVSCASNDDDEETAAKHPTPKYRTTYTSLGKHMTYRLATARQCSCGACRDPEPQLQLFYVNRAVYEETREVFYKENEFNMVLSSGLGCNAFMQDRAYALGMIRKLSFDVPLHTADFSYGRWTDKHYKTLFMTIKEKTGLRHLTLNFHGLVPDVKEDKWRCPCDCGNWEHPLLSLGQMMGVAGVPTPRTTNLHNKEWALFRALAEITDLPRLSINVDFCYHMLDHEGHDEDVFEHEHIRGFIGWLRSRMLKKGDALGTTQIHGYCRVNDEVEDKRYRFHSDDDEYGKSHLQIMKDGGHQSVARHDHMDSGSEADDQDMPDLDEMSDEWEDESDEDEEDEEDDDSDNGSELSMPPFEAITDDKEVPSLEVEDVD